MSFGLKITEPPILEMDKKDWVEYEGTYVSKRTAAALKAHKTRRKNKQWKKYKTISKENQRDILVDLLLKSNNEWMKYNHSRYTDEYKRNVIILESPELLFLKRIKEKNKEEIPVQVWIPNNKEFDKFEHVEWCNACKGNVWGEHQLKDYSNNWCDTNVLLLNQSYFDLVNHQLICDNGRSYRDLKDKLKSFSTCMIWADYCGAFTTYTKDIEQTFSSLILGNHSYYAMTFCKRDPNRSKKNKEYSYTNCIIAVNDFVSKAAKKHGYEVELLPESSMYKSNMYTVIFLVKYEMMDKCKEQITTLLDEHKKIKIELDHKIKDLDNLMYGLDRTGEQCDICGRYFKNVHQHKFCVHGGQEKPVILV